MSFPKKSFAVEIISDEITFSGFVSFFLGNLYLTVIHCFLDGQGNMFFFSCSLVWILKYSFCLYNKELETVRIKLSKVLLMFGTTSLKFKFFNLNFLI